MATVFDQHFAEAGITQAQFRLMLAVLEEGGEEGIRPSALADYLLIERATISVLTHRMVERGLLERGPGENRRTFNLTLTETGRRTLQELIPRAIALANHTLAEVTHEELGRMRATLEIVETQLRAYEKRQSEETKK